jgi:TPP-dependent pyruvate/acetoin dehydrogenase alpha subunit
MTDDDIIEWFEELAAVREHDHRIPRRNAESIALRIISEKYGQDAAKVAHRHAEARRAKGEDE